MISDVNDLPFGQYVSFEELGLSQDFQQHFSLLLTPEHQLLVLTKSEMHLSHLQFDLRRRLLRISSKEADAFVAIHELEVLSLIHI